jgi:hypothetical protein
MRDPASQSHDSALQALLEQWGDFTVESANADVLSRKSYASATKLDPRITNAIKDAQTSRGSTWRWAIGITAALVLLAVTAILARSPIVNGISKALFPEPYVNPLHRED